MLNIGLINKLVALRQTDNGIYLVDEEEHEVLLPNKYIPEGMKMGDEVDVFLYTDSEDRPIATTLDPKAKLYEYAALDVKDVASFGAFFDWGLEKDLLVPLSQQGKAVSVGETHVVYLYLDEKTDRLAGTTKIGPTLIKVGINLTVGDEVKVLPYEESDLGFSVIVNSKYQGMLYKNEVFTPISLGVETFAYVKKIRDDNKIDLSLNRFGYRAVDDNVVRLMDALEANNGSLNLNDKSSPNDISNQLGMSKKVFKKSVGALYRQKLIEISDSGIKLI